jgi:hypothetical protein
VSILRRRLHRAVALLGLPRFMLSAVAVVGVGRLMIVGMVVGCRERRFFKEMMDAMRCRSGEKKTEYGDDP